MKYGLLLLGVTLLLSVFIFSNAFADEEMAQPVEQEQPLRIE